MEIELYGLGRPTRNTRVAWALEEAGAPYTLRSVHPRSDEFLAINPMGKVPAMRVDGRVLTESGACCFWVADAFPEAGLLPADPWDRAQAQRWVDFALTELEQPLWLKAKHSFALPEEVRVPEAKAAAPWEFARAAAVLEQSLGAREHLVGDAFSLADLFVVHTLMWAQHARFDVPTSLSTYAMKHMARPAFMAAMQREQAGA